MSAEPSAFALARSPRLPRAVPEPAVIGICAPSGRVDEQALSVGVAYLRDLGHRVVLPMETVHAWRYFAGTDDERLAAFHALVDDPSIDLVMAARGGYGLSRLLPRIDWNRVAASGKAFVGFSDFTAFNMAAYACANLVTYHGPMLAVDFGRPETDSFTEQHFWMAVSRNSHRIDDIECAHGYGARRIDGVLWGGNLSLVAHLAGTPYFPAIDGGILYVEEIAEEPYAIERLFLQLQHCGVLGRQRAVLLGDFCDCVPSNPARYPYSMDEVVQTLREMLPVPVLTRLPFGHVARKVTLPFGAPGTLSLRDGGYSLRFSGHLQS
ncbi:MAG TPA: LD-carboxypeptidase [Myxococcota bacterium]|nr:LD-carboxypeptidase [Myxococcota bacterium]